jgi:uncharacterized membrane protein
VKRRQAIAVLALVGAIVATYLLLGKLGVVGEIACSVSHGCDTVNTSVYSEFVGLPVSGIGLAGYLAILAVALAGTSERWERDPRFDLMLSLLSGVAVVFTLYLTYAELFWIRAICQWCVLSQLIIVAIFVLAVIGVVRSRRSARAAE